MDKPKIVSKQNAVRTIRSVIPSFLILSLPSFLILSLLIGLIGYLISSTLQGFLVGFLMSYVLSWIVLASLIPFVGTWLQWNWSIAFSHWLIGLAFPATSTQYGNFANALIYVPLIIYTIVGIILCATVSFVAVVFLGAIIAKGLRS